MISKVHEGSLSQKSVAERDWARYPAQEFERHHMSNEDFAS